MPVAKEQIRQIIADNNISFKTRIIINASYPIAYS